jgi:hypothetical protein
LQGGLRVTTSQAVERFFDRLKAARDGERAAVTATIPRTPMQRRRDSEKAGARLRGKGAEAQEADRGQLDEPTPEAATCRGATEPAVCGVR